MPRDAPVTSATFPLSLISCLLNVAQTTQEDSRNHEVLDGDGVGVLCLQTDEDSTGLASLQSRKMPPPRASVLSPAKQRKLLDRLRLSTEAFPPTLRSSARHTPSPHARSRLPIS